MKIAIHDRKGSFSDRWIEICQERDIPYIIVNLFGDDLIGTLRREKVDALLAHPPMGDRRSAIAVYAVIQSVAASGLCEVFPTPADYWHFDDKVAQKYLFEALDIPTPKTHVFLERDEAVAWAEQAEFPWVFKLRAGAGSVNVTLVHDRDEAIKKINRMFGRGYAPHAGATKDMANKLAKHKRHRDWTAVAKRVPKTLANHWKKKRELEREKGYAYFQAFIPNNTHDTRITVIGNRAFGYRRGVRPDDFRASGSGLNDYDPKGIKEACVQAAFDAARQLGTTCMTFDFVQPADSDDPLIVEMSYAFLSSYVFKCPGHWRTDMTWQDGQMWPQDAMLEYVIQNDDVCLY